MEFPRKKICSFPLSIFLPIIFVAGIAIGFFLWNRINLPFSNPWNIKGPLAEAMFNPNNNILRFIVFVISPTFLLIILSPFIAKLFKTNKSESVPCPSNLSNLSKSKKNIFSVLLIAFSLLVALNLPTHSVTETFDSFHEGESLGTSISLLSGQKPYKDFLFVHGAYQDPIRSVFAFKLFGQSISSTRILESVTKLLVFVVLTLLIISIFKGNPLYTFLFLLFFAFLHLSEKFFLPKFLITPQRELTTYSFLLVVQLIASRAFVPCVLFFLFSFIPIASFGYSIDRGFYLFAAYLMLIPFIARRSKQFIFASLAGLVSAIVFFGWSIGWSYFDFVDFVFLKMPKYKELMDGFVFPINKVWFFLIVSLIAFNVFWVAFKLLKGLVNKDKFSTVAKKYLIEIALLILSVFMFRNALGRSDWSHVAYSSSLTFLLLFVIVFKHYLKLRHFFAVILFAAVIISSIAGIQRIKSNDLLSVNFPFGKEDSYYIPKNYRSTIAFLKENLSESESFFTMTSEASWYYFINKPCPSRFSVVWFAMPSFYQEEIIEDLKTNNVKFILYKNNYWSNYIDGFTNEERLPILTSYIKNNYRFFKKIDDNEIYSKM